MRYTGCALLILAILVGIAVAGRRGHGRLDLTTWWGNDRIALNAPGSGEKVADGWAVVTAVQGSGGCLNFAPTQSLTFANLVTFNGTCAPLANEEVVGVAPGRAMALRTGAPDHEGLWTDHVGDVRDIDMPAPVAMPVKAWTFAGVELSAKTMASGGVTVANVILAGRQLGVELELDPVIGVVALPSATGFADLCQAAATAAPGDGSTINLFFFDEIGDDAGGYWCGFRTDDVPAAYRDPGAILVSFNKSDPATIAHEVGHALGLLHTGDAADYNLPGFTQSNLMWNGVSRNVTPDLPASDLPQLTLGQAYRASFSAESYLNYGPAARRKGLDVRRCDCDFAGGACSESASLMASSTDGVCPRLQLDFHP